MVQRQGVDVRGGNWVFHNNGLLVAQDMPKERLNNTLLLPTSPDELREILQVNKSELLRTSENFYQQTRENNPNGRIYRPWLYTLKLALCRYVHHRPYCRLGSTHPGHKRQCKR